MKLTGFNPRLPGWYRNLLGALWALFLLALPVTSFPFFPPTLGGGALVRPLSLYPLIALFFLFTLPYLLTQRLPKTLLTLAPFIIVVLASSLLSLFRDIDPLMNVTVPERVLRALITLASGLAVYLTVSLYPNDWERLRASLRWLYAGFSLALLWGSLQAVYIIKFSPAYFQLLNRLQRFISIRRLFTTRISGMTYEPNWFAEQICVLLFPWLLASVLSGQSVFRWRWRRVTLEWFLLIWSVIVMAFTYSRAGLINLVVLAFTTLLIFRYQRRQARPLLKRWPLRLLEAGVLLALLSGLTYFVGARNNFFARIWDYWLTTKNGNISDYFEYLGFGARFSYAGAALNTYQAYPVLGVGLGNFAFYFNEMLPDKPLAAMPEVLRIVTPDASRNRLITAKILYVRLLAETGLVGLASFLAFLLAILGCALYLWYSPSRGENYWGTAGLLGIIVLVLSAFSFDSLAIPNMWVLTGMITAASWVALKASPETQSDELPGDPPAFAA
ncbi:MAG: O-antigen ligase family protein [Anaerolineales bacterium]|nr:O-antigen ligase family protein [Anaerolineales bacterium]